MMVHEGYIRQIVRAIDLASQMYDPRPTPGSGEIYNNMMYPLRVDFAVEGGEQPIVSLVMGYEDEWEHWHVEFHESEWEGRDE